MMINSQLLEKSINELKYKVKLKSTISLIRKMFTCPSKPNAAPDTSGCKK